MATLLRTGLTSLDIVLGVIALSLVLLFVTRTRPIPKGLRLPPGPRGRPVVGNVADIPTHHEWETYTRWAKDYGKLVYIKAFSQPMVFVNSMDVAHDLFEMKSSLYSDRFQFTMMNELIGFDWAFGLMPYGERWRRHRKAFHQHFRSNVAPAYHQIEAKHTRDLLRRLYESPDNFIEHLQHLAGATIMEVVYGIKVLPTDDPYIEIAENGLKVGAEAGNPGSFLVDTLPFLKHVPEWIPGAGFQRKARIWREAITKIPTVPFAVVKEALINGTAGPSVTASLLEELSYRKDAPVDAEEVIRNAMGQAYGAGAETSVSALTSFVLAMVLYPEVQRKAQAELDSVIGKGRLPSFEDRGRLSYVNAVCKEVLRWHPVVPLGVAHRVMQDDIYGDYLIPGGSIVIGNAWAMLHDEKTYGPEPEKFQPERFLKPGVKDPLVAFGFGRRICPGRHMADDSIFIAVVSILQLFDISPARDGRGNEIAVEASFTSGFLSHPEPFRCSIKPRPAFVESIRLMTGDIS